MTRRVLSTGLIGLYLAAIIAANLSSAKWGPDASIINAFVFVGLVLTTRDRLNDIWRENRIRNMALLILSGSAVSFAAAHIFPGAAPPDVVARIALASACAFLSAETFDFVTYSLLHRRPWLERSTSSNIVGAAFDSAVFVSIAFGWSWQIIVAQMGAKVAGGYVAALILRHVRERNAPEVV